jgi:CubicO group peptidase (beta-lactamase class C family)
MRHTSVVTALLLLGSATAGAAQSGGAGFPADAVNRFVESELARQSIPGVSVTVLRGDSVVLMRGYGYANVELHVPASDSTIYQSGSMGKQFTSAVVMQLVNAGRLKLDDPITKWFPEGREVWRGITVRHLLTHTSGIPDYTGGKVDYRRAYTEDELVRMAAKEKLIFRPGDRWSYSNTGYLMLGALVRRVAGRFYGDVLQDSVFGPVGMRTTRVISEADIIPNRADGYVLVDGQLKNQSWVSPELNTTADGALYFTVRDLAAWAVNLNHRKVPGDAALTASWTPVRLNDGGTFPYGFGWRVDQQRGYPRIGHGGSWQGFRTAISRYPDFGLTVVVLANLGGAQPEGIAFGIAGIVEPKLAAPHLLPAGAGDAGPRPVADLLRALATGADADVATPGLRRFLSPDTRKQFGNEGREVSAWTPLGCDDLTGRTFAYLGAKVARACYARSASGSPYLAEVLYAADGRVTGLEVSRF